MSKLLLFSITLSIVLLTACSYSTGVVPSPVPSISDTPEATAEATHTSTPTKVVPTPSASMTQSATPTIKPPTPTPTEILPPENILKYECLEVFATLPANADVNGTLVLSSPDGLSFLDFDQDARWDITDLIPAAGTSPDGKWLAYSRMIDDKWQIVIDAADVQQRFQVREEIGWLIFHSLFWLDNERLWIPTYPPPGKVAGVVVVDPFTGEQMKLPSDYPGIKGYQWGISSGAGLHFGVSSVVYDPSLDLVIYPEFAEDGYFTVLWDLQSKKPLVRLPDGSSYGNLPLWLPGSNQFVVVEHPDWDSAKEWLMVSRDGQQVLQLTHFGDYFGDYFSDYEIQNNASVSPDGRYLAFGLSLKEEDGDGLGPEQLILLNLETLEVVNTCIPVWYDVAAWSLDSRYLAVGTWSAVHDDTPVVLLDLEQKWAAQVMEGWRVSTVGWLVSP